MAKARKPSPATAHTPGPWAAVRRECQFGCGDGVPLYFRIVPRGRRDALGRTFACPEQEANARLMAVAPDLLGVAQDVLDWLAAVPATVPGRSAMEKGLRTIIARANGRRA